jgi:hypothetical protein
VTPDERAERAERVIEETVHQFRQFADWFQQDATHVGLVPSRLMTYAAEELARNARIAGIAIASLKGSAHDG